jgi:hypothetical protein
MFTTQQTSVSATSSELVYDTREHRGAQSSRSLPSSFFVYSLICSPHDSLAKCNLHFLYFYSTLANWEVTPCRTTQDVDIAIRDVAAVPSKPSHRSRF